MFGKARRNDVWQEQFSAPFHVARLEIQRLKIQLCIGNEKYTIGVCNVGREEEFMPRNSTIIMDR